VGEKEGVTDDVRVMEGEGGLDNEVEKEGAEEAEKDGEGERDRELLGEAVRDLERVDDLESAAGIETTALFVAVGVGVNNELCEPFPFTAGPEDSVGEETWENDETLVEIVEGETKLESDEDPENEGLGEEVRV